MRHMVRQRDAELAMPVTVTGLSVAASATIAVL